jgi:glycosyltransferase involved in cell wall biosynthesis
MMPFNINHFTTMTGWGGIERMLMDFFQNVSSNHIYYSLITTSSTEEMAEIIGQLGIRWFQPTGRFRYDPNKFLQMASWLRRNQIQLVHSYNSNANAWAWISTQLAGTSCYITGEHGSLRRVRPPIAWLDRLAQSNAVLNLANSRASARFLEGYYRIPSHKIRVVYNAMPLLEIKNNVQLRTLLGIPKDALVVGSVGRLSVEKDYQTFIRGAALVRRMRRNVLFVLIGGGPEEQMLRDLISQLGLQDCFFITGWRKDARDLIQTFDIFVSTSIWEAFGNALVEAAMCAKPVIAPAIDGIPEAVEEGRSGILLKPTLPYKRLSNSSKPPIVKYVLIENNFMSPKSLDPDILANAINYFLEHPDLRRQFGSYGRERAERLFTINRYIYDLETIYTSLLAN